MNNKKQQIQNLICPASTIQLLLKIAKLQKK